MRGFSLALLVSIAPLAAGCVGTLVDVATLPVRAAGKAVDLATTSQSEADENRGRELRKREERLGQLERAYAKQRKKCEDGNENSCRDARETYAEIQRILPTIPAEVDD